MAEEKVSHNYDFLWQNFKSLNQNQVDYISWNNITVITNFLYTQIIGNERPLTLIDMENLKYFCFDGYNYLTKENEIYADYLLYNNFFVRFQNILNTIRLLKKNWYKKDRTNTFFVISFIFDRNISYSYLSKNPVIGKFSIRFSKTSVGNIAIDYIKTKEDQPGSENIITIESFESLLISVDYNNSEYPFNIGTIPMKSFDKCIINHRLLLTTIFNDDKQDMFSSE